MTYLLAFPFRINPNGSAAVQEDDTEQYYAAELAVMIQTEPGERLLVPGYGVEDLAFDPFPIMTLRAQIEQYGPPVVIQDTIMLQLDEETLAITVQFDLVSADDLDAEFILGS